MNASAPTCCGLLIRTQPGGAFTFAAAARTELGIDVEPLFPSALVTRSTLGSARALGAWLLSPVESSSDENPWELAHRTLRRLGFADGSAYVEPDLLQWFPASVRSAPLAGSTQIRAVPEDRGPDLPDQRRLSFSDGLFRTSALARAFDNALRPNDGADRDRPGNVLPPVDVVSLSTGGLASAAWADAVNAAYEAGVCIVAASGNTFRARTSAVPTRLTVYPARFRRVIAVSGVADDRRPDDGAPIRNEACSRGPSKVASALAAFTSNMPGAEMGAQEIARGNGGGACGATAQVASAAALWIATHRAELDRYLERWQRVEAVRHALFTSADVLADGAQDEKLGRAILQTTRALTLAPRSRLATTPRDQGWLPLARALTGPGIDASPGRRSMLAVEATQLTQLLLRDRDDMQVDPDAQSSRSSGADTIRVVELLLEHPRASAPLRAALERARQQLGAKRASPPPALPRLATLPTSGAEQSPPHASEPGVSLTIGHFESALGRRALWPPRAAPQGAAPKHGSTEPRRRRLYSHAAHDLNTYDGPSRMPFLVGGLEGSDDDRDVPDGGGTAPSCSYDVVVHETAHQLIDGMHLTHTRPVNPDARVFHEAFADVVALLQHFTYREMVRDKIRRSCDAVRSQENPFAVLATELGRGTGPRGELRDHIGKRDRESGTWRPHLEQPPDSARREPHAHGAVFVAAVFDAFLSIYERRTRNVVRLLSGDSGIPSDADDRPELVERLAEEAARTAEHVLRMCIRALDYCPPVDLTFGEFLRALITADRDLVPDDYLGYRLAFIVAFRRRAIEPHHLRTLSEQSLAWRGLGTTFPSRNLILAFASVLAHRNQLAEPSCEKLHHAAEALRRDLHDSLSKAFGDREHGARDAALLGLEIERSSDRFEVHAARFADRVDPDGRRMPQCIVELLQRKMKPVDPTRPEGERTVFEGGSTVVLDLAGGPGASDLERSVAIRYVIRKSVGSVDRLERQVQYESSRAETLFESRFEERAAVHEM